MAKKIKLTKKEAKAGLWKRGILKWILREEQRAIYDIIRGASGLMFTLYCSRRWGKSFISLLTAFEDCLTHKNWEIGFVAPTQMSLKRIYRPIMDVLTKDCPESIKPNWKADFNGYVFPSTGSILFMSGTDNKRYEDLRGMNLHRAYLDEPGTMSDLSIIVNSILLPQTLTTKEERGGSVGIVLLGTPSPTPAHDYFFIKEQCKSLGNYAEMTIEDNSSLDEQTIEEYLNESGGRDSDVAQREYFCKDVVDVEKAVIPEFTADKEKEIVKELPRPDCYRLYGSMDPGFSDFTGYLLGFYDFLNARYVVEGELLLNKSPTPVLAEKIKELEKELFSGEQVYLRYSDTNPQVICDLAQLHGLQFVATAKDNKEAQINHLRTLILNNRLYIHPRCVNLIRHLKTAIWNEQRTKFLRTETEGHFDLVDTIIYLVRNIDIYTNPYPASWAGVNGDTFVKAGYNQKNNMLADAIMGR